MRERCIQVVNSQFSRFLTAGLVNSLVGYLTFLLCWAVFEISAGYSNFISYVVGVCVSFVLNNIFVFRKADFHYLTALRFLLAFVIAYASNLIVLIGLIHLGLKAPLAQFGAMGTYTLVFYFLNKTIVWR